MGAASANGLAVGAHCAARAPPGAAVNIVGVGVVDTRRQTRDTRFRRAGPCAHLNARHGFDESLHSQMHDRMVIDHQYAHHTGRRYPCSGIYW